MATTLTYTVSDFIPFTKILSSDVNSRFNDIKNRLNWAGGSDATTGLGDDNIQSNTASGGGLTRSTKLKAGTANYAVYNDADGKLTEAASLPTTAGGLGFIPTINSTNAGKAVVINSGGSAFELGSPNQPTLTESLAGDVSTLVAGESISVLDAVCIALAKDASNNNIYKIFKCDSDSSFDRKTNFLGIAIADASVTAHNLTWTNSAALVTGNIITWSINERTYSQSFSVDNDTTLAAIAAQIASDPDVLSASVVNAGTDDRVINIVGEGSLQINITSATVTGGASQATVTIATTQAPSGDNVLVRTYGPVTGFSGLSVTSSYYISTTAGALTDAPTDTNPVFVGQALSSSVIFVNRLTTSNQPQFSISTLFIRAYGSTAGETMSSAVQDSEHFNFTSWSTGATDTGGARCRLHIGAGSFNGSLHIIDGANTSGNATTTARTYNKTSWSAGTTRGTPKCNQQVSTMSGKMYFGRGSTGTDRTSTTQVLESWNGSTWSTEGGVTFALGTVNAGCFQQGSLVYFSGGTDSAGNQRDENYSYDGSSIATSTAMPVISFSFGSSKSAGSKGICGGGTSGNSTREWNGSSWSSAIAFGYTAGATGGSNVGAASGYNSSNSKSYFNGGTSASTTAIATTNILTSSTWATGTSSNTARSGGEGDIF